MKIGGVVACSTVMGRCSEAGEHEHDVVEHDALVEARSPNVVGDRVPVAVQGHLLVVDEHVLEQIVDLVAELLATPRLLDLSSQPIVFLECALRSGFASTVN